MFQKRLVLFVPPGDSPFFAFLLAQHTRASSIAQPFFFFFFLCSGFSAASGAEGGGGGGGKQRRLRAVLLGDGYFRIKKGETDIDTDTTNAALDS
jgi:hypothetical protein